MLTLDISCENLSFIDGMLLRCTRTLDTVEGDTSMSPKGEKKKSGNSTKKPLISLDLAVNLMPAIASSICWLVTTEQFTDLSSLSVLPDLKGNKRVWHWSMNYMMR